MILELTACELAWLYDVVEHAVDDVWGEAGRDLEQEIGQDVLDKLTALKPARLEDLKTQEPTDPREDPRHWDG